MQAYKQDSSSDTRVVGNVAASPVKMVGFPLSPCSPLIMRSTSTIERLPFSTSPAQLPEISKMDIRSGSSGNLLGGGVRSPGRKTMKDYEQQQKTLEEENFKLKLRVYMLEERLQRRDTPENTNEMIVELKVQLAAQREELGQKKELLKRASQTLESLEQQYSQELERQQEETETDRRLLEQRIQQLELSLERANEDRQRLTDRSCLETLESPSGRALSSASRPEDELTSLENKMAELQPAIGAMKQTLEERKVEAGDLRQQLQEARTESDRQGQRAAEAERQLELTRAECARQTQLARQAESRRQQFESEAQRAADADKHLQEARAEQHRQEQRAAEAEQRLQEVRAELARQSQRAAEADRRLEEVRTECVCQSQRASEAEQRLQEVLAESRRQSERAAAAERRLELLETEAGAVHSQRLDSVQSQLDSKLTELAQCAAERDRLRDRVKLLEQSAGDGGPAAEAKVTELQRKLTEATDQIRRAAANESELQAALLQVSAQLKKRTGDLTESRQAERRSADRVLQLIQDQRQMQQLLRRQLSQQQQQQQQQQPAADVQDRSERLWAELEENKKLIKELQEEKVELVMDKERQIQSLLSQLKERDLIREPPDSQQEQRDCHQLHQCARQLELTQDKVRQLRSQLAQATLLVSERDAEIEGSLQQQRRLLAGPLAPPQLRAALTDHLDRMCAELSRRRPPLDLDAVGGAGEMAADSSEPASTDLPAEKLELLQAEISSLRQRLEARERCVQQQADQLQQRDSDLQLASQEVNQLQTQLQVAELKQLRQEGEELQQVRQLLTERDAEKVALLSHMDEQRRRHEQQTSQLGDTLELNITAPSWEQYSEAVQRCRRLRRRLAQSQTACELLRTRLEELADFLQLLLQLEQQGLLDLSSVSAQSRADLQLSLLRSRELSQSLTQSLLVGLEVDGDEDSDCSDDSLPLPDTAEAAVLAVPSVCEAGTQARQGQQLQVVVQQLTAELAQRASRLAELTAQLETSDTQAQQQARLIDQLRDQLNQRLLTTVPTVECSSQTQLSALAGGTQLDSSLYGDDVRHSSLMTRPNGPALRDELTSDAADDASSLPAGMCESLPLDVRYQLRSLVRRQRDVGTVDRAVSPIRPSAVNSPRLRFSDQPALVVGPDPDPYDDTGTAREGENVRSPGSKAPTKHTDGSDSVGRPSVPQPPAEFSESEAWSEPDRDVSLARIGLDQSSLETRTESWLGSTSGHSDSETRRARRRQRQAALAEIRTLEARIASLQQVKNSLRAEVDIYQKVLPEKKHESQTPKTGIMVPLEVLTEIHNLQQQLERAISANEHIRRQMELPPAHVSEAPHAELALALKITQEELEECSQKLSVSQQCCQELKNKLQRAKDNLRKAHLKAEEFKEKFVRVSDDMVHLRQRFTQMESDKERLVQEFGRRRQEPQAQERQEQKKAVTHLQTELDRARSRLHDQERLVQQLRDQLVQQPSQLHASCSDSQLLQLNREKLHLLSERAQLESRCRLLRSESCLLGGERQQAAAERRLEAAKWAGWEVERQRLTEEHAQCGRRLAELTQTLLADRQRLAELSRQLELANAQLELMKNKLTPDDDAAVHSCPESTQSCELPAGSPGAEIQAAGATSDQHEPQHESDRTSAYSSPDLGIESDCNRCSSPSSHTALPAGSQTAPSDRHTNANRPEEVSLTAENALLRQQRDEMHSKLAATRSALQQALDKLSRADQRKARVERAICKQLSRTHDILRRAKTNLAPSPAGPREAE